MKVLTNQITQKNSPRNKGYIPSIYLKVLIHWTIDKHPYMQ